MEYTCSYCGKCFIPKRTDSMYCSHSCRQFAYVLRKSNKGEVTDISTKKLITHEDKAVNSQLSDCLIEQVTSHVENENNLSVKTQTALPVKVENQLSVRTDIEQADCMYTSHDSRYRNQLDRLYGERDLCYSLSKFFDTKDDAGVWLSERYRCLLEILLIFSEAKRIELDDLKEVCNAFTAMINSKYFKYVHSSYPYLDEIKKWREQIRNVCLGTVGEHLKYRLRREQKQELIVARFELSQYVIKRKFNDLKFKEN